MSSSMQAAASTATRKAPAPARARSVKQSTACSKNRISKSSLKKTRPNSPRLWHCGVMAKPLAVFCDFDGTITERDMIVTVCEKFCPPGWERIKEEILSRRKSVRAGVTELFAMIPSNQKDAIIRYAHDIVRWRSGFQEFLEFCKTNGLLFIVCSGGIDFFVEPLMAPY